MGRKSRRINRRTRNRRKMHKGGADGFIMGEQSTADKARREQEEAIEGRAAAEKRARELEPELEKMSPEEISQLIQEHTEYGGNELSAILIALQTIKDRESNKDEGGSRDEGGVPPQ